MMPETIAPPIPQLARLDALVGNWEGHTVTRFMPDSEPLESRTSSTFRWVAAGHYMLQEYSSTCDGKVANGSQLIGYDEGKGKHTTAWGDSFHASSGLLISEGAPTEEALLDVLTHYPAPEGPPWGWRSVIDMPAKDQLRIRWYNIMPGHEGYVAVETLLQRQP